MQWIKISSLKDRGGVQEHTSLRKLVIHCADGLISDELNLVDDDTGII